MRTLVQPLKKATDNPAAASPDPGSERTGPGWRRVSPSGSSRFGLPLRRAIRVDLIVSLATVAAALTARWWGSSLGSARPFSVEIGAVLVGRMVGATIGSRWLSTVSDRHPHHIVGLLLLGIAALLFAEAALGDGLIPALPAPITLRASLGLVAGVGIGVVSSLLGVAGGELLIPTCVFAFGADVKTAGAPSLLVSFPRSSSVWLRHMRIRYGERLSEEGEHLFRRW